MSSLLLSRICTHLPSLTRRIFSLNHFTQVKCQAEKNKCNLNCQPYGSVLSLWLSYLQYWSPNHSLTHLILVSMHRQDKIHLLPYWGELPRKDLTQYQVHILYLADPEKEFFLSKSQFNTEILKKNFLCWFA